MSLPAAPALTAPVAPGGVSPPRRPLLAAALLCFDASMVALVRQFYQTHHRPPGVQRL